MRKILSCEFNLDTACVELCLDDGTLLSIHYTAIENEMLNSIYQSEEATPRTAGKIITTNRTGIITRKLRSGHIECPDLSFGCSNHLIGNDQ